MVRVPAANSRQLLHLLQTGTLPELLTNISSVHSSATITTTTTTIMTAETTSTTTNITTTFVSSVTSRVFHVTPGL